MTRPQRRNPSGAVALLAAGATHLAAGIAALGVTPTTCLPQTPTLAAWGIRAGLLVESDACPTHSYMPGVHFAPAAASLVAFAAAILAVGIAALLMAFGVGHCIRRIIGSARQWLRARLVPAGIGLARRILPGPIPASCAAWTPARRPYHPLLRRGPPLPSC